MVIVARPVTKTAWYWRASSTLARYGLSGRHNADAPAVRPGLLKNQGDKEADWHQVPDHAE